MGTDVRLISEGVILYDRFRRLTWISKPHTVSTLIDGTNGLLTWISANREQAEEVAGVWPEAVDAYLKVLHAVQDYTPPKVLSVRFEFVNVEGRWTADVYLADARTMNLI